MNGSSIVMGLVNVRGGSTSATMRRSDVKNGMVFVIAPKKGKTLKDRTPYAHTGTRTIPPSKEVRYQSVNLLTGEEASSPKGSSRVIVIGTWSFDVDIQDDYSALADKITVAQVETQ